MMDPLTLLAPIMRDIVAPQAQEVDRNARFPRAAIQAAGAVGLLGLLSATGMGGMGQSLAVAATVVQQIAQECPSTAMVLTMHYSAAVLIEAYGPVPIRQAIATGQHLSTLAWSEKGSRSHFWAPVGSARSVGADIVLDADKSMVTAAGEADSYVWSSRPCEASGVCTLWLVNSRASGLSVPHKFDGLGLRGNASAPVCARGVRVGMDARLGADGEGVGIMNAAALPVVACLLASVSIGLMEGALQRALHHVTATRFADTGGSLADLPTLRAYLARACIRLDQARALRDDTLIAIAQHRADALRRILQVKASAAEAALEVTETVMRVCGGAAFRRETGIERLFRDARAAAVMAPTSDGLFDLLGRHLCGLPLGVES